MLYACLISTKNLLDHYISQPDAVFLAHCCIDLAHMGFGISTLMRLTLAEEVGWDLAEVRQTANITFYFDRFIQQLEDAGKTIDQQQTAPCRQSFPTGCAKAMKRVAMWYDTVVPRGSGEQIVAAEQQELFSLGMEVGGLFGDDVSGYLNDTYWLEFMGSQEFMQTL